MGDLDELQRTFDRINKVNATLMPKVATVAINFFKQRFIAQNWVDTTTKVWRRKLRSNRAILTKTGRLKRSIRKGKVTATSAVIETDVPYAYAHNYGVNKTVDVRKHKRKSYKKVKEKYTTRTGRERTRTTRQATEKEATVKSHKRRMRLHQNQFIGPSAILNRQIERMVTAEYIRALK